MYSVGAKASVRNVENRTEAVTDSENRRQTILIEFRTNVTGTNIVISISATLTTVLATRPTVPCAVLPGDRFLAITTCLMPLIIMTVLLIRTLTVRITLNTASMPTEKFSVSTAVNAFTNVIGIISAGTSAQWTPRRNRNTIVNISNTVLFKAQIIPATEIPMNGEALHGTPHLMPVGKQCVSLLTPVCIVAVAPSVPVFGDSRMLMVADGPLPRCALNRHLRSLTLICVILLTCIAELLGSVPSMTLVNLLGADNRFPMMTAVATLRASWAGKLLTSLVEIRVPRVITVVPMLVGARPKLTSPRGLT